MSEFVIQRTPSPKPRPPESELGFGRCFSDHMLLIDYDPKAGWHGGRIVPYGPLSLDPAAAVFHYGQAIFEGLKAFRGKGGAVRLFRAEDHCRRLQRGAPRMCMPAVDPGLLLRGIVELVKLDRSWVPSGPGTALYIRPTLIASEPFLGVRPAERYLLYVILSPVGPYYGESALKPVKIWIEEHYTRAAPGGLGDVKAGANYAASLKAAHDAKARGYAQVLWLDAVHHQNFEEVGTMNFFFVIGDEVVTPPLDGTILAGMTRDSILWLLRSWGVKVQERSIGYAEVQRAHQSGQLKEAFGSGTAAVIAPVLELARGDVRLDFGSNAIGPLARRLYETISGIQRGELPDPERWCLEIPA
jgi:branched-chain amino acid aminotransferase